MPSPRLEAMADRAKRSPSDRKLRYAAKERYHREGTIEIDDTATISRGADDGAYVQAWVWVPFSDVRG